MMIKSPQELCSFIVGNGLVGMCPESQGLVACMDILSRMCACDPVQAKTARFNQCRQLYINFVSRASDFGPTLFSKANDNRISFYLSNQLLREINR